jgi:hypothetical protein
MAAITGLVPGKRCGCGARRDKAAKRCAKCEARAAYWRTRHHQKIARRRANHFSPIRLQRKDMPS